jgi:hypothetical protein
MGFLIGLAARAVGEKLAGPLVYALIAAALAGAVWWLRADAYSDGEAAEKASWEKAIAETEIEAGEVARDVEEERDTRTEDWSERVREEKEKIDEATEAGSDPFDVLFPSGGV